VDVRPCTRRTQRRTPMAPCTPRRCGGGGGGCGAACDALYCTHGGLTLCSHASCLRACVRACLRACRYHFLKHSPTILDRDIMAKVWQEFPEAVAKTIHYRHRKPDGVSMTFLHHHYCLLDKKSSCFVLPQACVCVWVCVCGVPPVPLCPWPCVWMCVAALSLPLSLSRCLPGSRCALAGPRRALSALW